MTTPDPIITAAKERIDVMSTNCIDCVVNKRTGGDLMCDLCRLTKVAEREKIARVYYQDIVYHVCGVIDKITGRSVRNGTGTVCGTSEAPTTQVRDRLKELTDLIDIYVPRREIERKKAGSV